MATKSSVIRFLSLLLLSALVLYPGVGPLRAGPTTEKDSAAKDGLKDSSSSPKAPSAEERIGSLEETIRVLEARIKELEARGSKVEADPVAAKSAPAAEVKPEPGTAATEPPKTGPPPPVGNRQSFFDKIEFSGFADTYYGYNFNRPASRKNSLRNFDFNHNQFSLNLLEFAMEKKAEPVGFRFDLNFGDTAKWVHSVEPGGSDVYQYVQQAYFSYKAPMGKGLTIDFGKFVTQHGAEVIETKDNWNYSRSILFSWAIPYYHFGTRLTYPLSDKLAVAGYVVNGWNDVVDNNSGKTVGFQAVVKPSSRLTIIQNYMVGKEQPNNVLDLRHLVDTTVTFAVTPSFSLMANYDYGMDRLLGERVRWQGFAGYARFQVTPVFAIAPRIEWYDDPHGFTTGLGQTLKEATLTTEFKLRGGILARAEYRRDWSDLPFFEKRGGLLSKSQNTATLGLIYVLGQEP
jgi:hypothetical protein